MPAAGSCRPLPLFNDEDRLDSGGRWRCSSRRADSRWGSAPPSPPTGRLRALGFDETGPAGTALARVLGARDLALASVALAARDDRAALRTATLAAAALDAADAAAFLVALRDPATRQAGIRGVLFAGGAAAAGFWAARRLG